MTFRKKSCCFIFLITVHILRANAKQYSIATWKPISGIQEHQIEAKNVSEAIRKIPHKYAVGGILENAINETGWAFQEIHTFDPYEDVVQAYGAGFVEGYTARHLIYAHFNNMIRAFCDGRIKLCNKIQEYLDTNERWVKEMIANYSSTEPYWHQVKLFYKQLEGVVDGYNYGWKNTSMMLTANNFLWLNVQGDLEDLTTAMNRTDNSTCELSHILESGPVLGSGSCSALIKLLPNNSDLYVGHDTWSSYQSMLRVQKKYVFRYHVLANSSERIPGFAMTFSSYPGIITSGDDFYLISSGIATLETTIGNANDSLWTHVQPKGQVMETVRSMVANRLGRSGRSWTKLFTLYNSGTYNNQWMVVDYKCFKKGNSTIQNNLLWVLEQIPGMVQARDMTHVLREQSYWPSYNVPAFPQIFNMSGNVPLVKRYGDWFTYERNPRALIFKRDHDKVRDTTSMLALMEYNDYKNDPFSRCNCTPPYSAENAIAARCDLNPANGTYPFKALGHRSHGSIDTKITTADLFMKLKFISRSGPVYNENLPPFVWSEADFGSTTPHMGHPNVWQFEPVTHQWQWR
ncbi:putative phospholipase B-like 2 [Anabrus simplex]|uniref:putative phospholipase B-like 2 n=1 Tax=Anabrus simplex TaxID=316456 RepID=UPI0035A39F7F